MIYAIGIDTVDIQRFTHFIHYKDKHLGRFFSAQEITYCRSSYIKSAERFAVRFAAKEAFFKAFSQSPFTQNQSFFCIARSIMTIINQQGIPQLAVDWQKLILNNNQYPETHISLTHSKNNATACVILSAPPQ